LRIVLDTNVLVSALLTPFGGPGQILELINSGKLEILLDNRIYSEYREVLSRDKFGIPPHVQDIVLERLSRKALWISPGPLSLKLPDASDVMFVEVAVSGRAGAIVTGNKKHFPRNRMSGISILSPKQLLRKL